MTISVKEILVKARNKIENPENWCKKAKARTVEPDANNTGCMIACHSCDPKACQWCATGAIDSVIPSNVVRRYFENRVKAKILLSEICPMHSIISYNDHKTTLHKDIIRVFDRAIEIADTVKIKID